MDTEKQKMKKSMTKEDLLRLCWLKRGQGGNLHKPSVRGTEHKKGSALPHMDRQKKAPTKQEKEASEKKGEAEKPEAGGKVATVSLSDMRPVTPEVRALLYDGFSKEEKGRYQYLKARTKKGPSEKYEFAITSAWEYGWKLDDDADYKKPSFGRSAKVETTFYRRNGIFSKLAPNDVLD
ncbi:protein SPMIP1-like [Scyliorhinus torazame]|uniref:protein SPMIP1-like n=1 Tax=Scyliorhinus torazame TaxID=75743 RepID=UPI003B598609